MTTVSAVVPFWEDAPELYGTLTLGAHVLRGITDVRIKRGRKRDKKSAPGTNGAKLSNKGFEAASVDITWQVHREESGPVSARWDEAGVILADLEDKKRKETGLAITHPFAAIRGIQAVVIDDIEGPIAGGESGLFTFSLKCTEYTTPAAAKKGGKGGGGGKAGEPFDATVSAIGPDGKTTGVPYTAKVIEKKLGEYRDTKNGKIVRLLDVHAADKLTPLEREKKAAADKAAGGPVAPEGDAYYQAPGGTVGGDVAFVEDAEGNVTEKDVRTVKELDTGP